MKSRSIIALVFVAALFTPSLPAQDVPDKIREIERKVLLEQYEKAIHSLVAAADEIGSGSTGTPPESLGKRLDWLAMVGGQLGGDDRMLVANGQDMSGSAGVLNDLAWGMITSPDAEARHPEIALKLADIAIELGGGNEDLKPRMLDTRARALFLLGKRDEAIAGQEMAVAAAMDPAEKRGFEATLASYRSGAAPEVLAPVGGDAGAAVPEAALAAKDLRSRTDEILRLQKLIETAGKELSGTTKEELDRAKMELRERMDDLAQLTMPREEGTGSSGATYILGKLRSIILPSIDFKDATLEEAVAFLRKKSIELDPARKGVNIVVRGSAPGKVDPVRIKELSLRNVPLSEALRYICEATRFRYKVDDYAITLVSQDAPEDLFNRTFAVPPDFGSTLVPIEDLLKLCGVKFGEGASATLMTGGMLVVRNTPTEIDKIEQLVEADQIARAKRNAPPGRSPATGAAVGK